MEEQRNGDLGHGHGQHEHHEHHHGRHHEIFVNTVEKHWDKDRIDYDQLVKLSGLPVPPGPEPGFTISYFDGPHEKPTGHVEPGHSVRVHNHEKFVVTPTHRS